MRSTFQGISRLCAGLGLLLFFACDRARAEGWVGLSAFGIQSQNFQDEPCEEFLAAMEVPENPATAMLFNTFGTNKECIEEFWLRAAAQGKRHLTEIHFSNEAGRRTGLLDLNDFLAEYSVDDYNLLLEEMPKWLDARIRRRIGRIMDMISDYVHTGYFILSTGLEDNYTNLAWENLYKIFQEEWPSAIGRSPAFIDTWFDSNWRVPEGVYMELHGYRRKLSSRYPLCIANGDGHDVDFLKDSGRFFRGAAPADLTMVKNWIARSNANRCITLFWAGKWQGFFHDTDPPPAPLSREFHWDPEDRVILKELINYAQSGITVEARRPSRPNKKPSKKR